MGTDLPPTERTIIPPENGWERKSYYIVDVALRPTNPIHRAIFYSGFLNSNEPAGYNQLWSPTYEETFSIGKLHYLKVVRKIEGVHREN